MPRGKLSHSLIIHNGSATSKNYPANDGGGCNLYVFDIHHQKDFVATESLRIRLCFGLCFPAEANKKTFLCSFIDCYSFSNDNVEQKQFDILSVLREGELAYTDKPSIYNSPNFSHF